MKIVESLFSKVMERKRQRVDVARCDIRTLVQLIGDAEDGANVDVDLDLFAERLDQAGMSEADVRASVGEYISRKRRYPEALATEDLRATAERAERDFRDADLAEGKRRRAAMQELRELELQVEAASRDANAAMVARADLIASADVSDEERGLNEKLAQVIKAIRAAEDALNPGFSRVVDATGHGSHSVGPTSMIWADIRQWPATLVTQTKQHLAQAGLSPERKEQLQHQRAAAERAVEERQAELQRLAKQRDAINAELKKLNDRKMLPESFRLVRATPTPDERRKAEAIRLGFGNNGVSR